MPISLGFGLMLDGSGNSYDPSASAWFAAMPTQPTRQIQMAHYGAGLDATQAANLNTRVQTAVAALTVL